MNLGTRCECARRHAEELGRQITRLAHDVADSEDRLATVLEQAARLRPHAAARLLHAAANARHFADEERGLHTPSRVGAATLRCLRARWLQAQFESELRRIGGLELCRHASIEARQFADHQHPWTPDRHSTPAGVPLVLTEPSERSDARLTILMRHLDRARAERAG